VRPLARLSNLLVRSTGTLANILLLGMISATGIQVIARFVLGSPTAWSEELARFLLVAITMLGSAVLLEKNQHITIDIFFDMMPPKVRAWVAWLRDAITLTVCGMLAYYGWILVGIGSRQTSTGLAVKMSVPYMAIPIGAGLMALVLVLSRLGRVNENEWEDQ